jgi:hypothetical protein
MMVGGPPGPTRRAIGRRCKNPVQSVGWLLIPSQRVATFLHRFTPPAERSSAVGEALPSLMQYPTLAAELEHEI